MTSILIAIFGTLSFFALLLFIVAIRVVMIAQKMKRVVRKKELSLNKQLDHVEHTIAELEELRHEANRQLAVIYAYDVPAFMDLLKKL